MNMLTISILLTIRLLNKIQSVLINNRDSIAFLLLVYLYSFMRYNAMNFRSFLMNKFSIAKGQTQTLSIFKKPDIPGISSLSSFSTGQCPKNFFQRAHPTIMWQTGVQCPTLHSPQSTPLNSPLPVWKTGEESGVERLTNLFRIL